MELLQFRNLLLVLPFSHYTMVSEDNYRISNVPKCLFFLRKRLRVYTLHNSKKAVTAD